MASRPEIEDHPILFATHRKTVSVFRQHLRFQRVPRGTILAQQQTPIDQVLLLHFGMVHGSRNNAEGCSLSVRVLAGPAIIGASECLTSPLYQHTWQALGPTQVWQVHRASFLAALKSSHELCLNLLWDAQMLTSRSDAWMHLLKTAPIKTQLAHLLTSFAESCGVMVEGGRLIPIPLRHKDLAQLVGANRRSVSRTLGDWYERGVVHRDGRHLVVCDQKALDKEVGTPTLNMVHTSQRPATPTAVRCA